MAPRQAAHMPSIA